MSQIKILQPYPQRHAIFEAQLLSNRGTWQLQLQLIVGLLGLHSSYMFRFRYVERRRYEQWNTR